MDQHLHAEDLADIASIAGPYGWGMIHHAFETFPCAPCARSGGSLGRGIHDVVNYHIGNPMQYPHDLEYLRQAVAEIPPQLGAPSPADLEAEVSRLAGGISLTNFPKCDPREAITYERCVQSVKKQGTTESPHAICTVSVGCSPRSKR